MRRGRGDVARVIVGAKKFPAVSCFALARASDDANGAPKGRAESKLWDTLRFVNSGNAKTFGGSDVKRLWDKSSDVRAVRSANVTGRDRILFL